jgi:formylmethanofuran dehydrogenase subunit C
MKPLHLSLKSEPAQRLDLSPLVPHRLTGKSLADIASLVISTTRETVTVGDVFKIKGPVSDEILIEGGSARFDGVGQGLQNGVLHIDGDVGQNAGRLMSGGALTVNGDTGPYAGSGMSGGRFEIAGDTGDFLGGPREGEIHGMSGGLLIVRGSAGARAADRLRRGTVIVEGDAGDYPASRIQAGTLVVLGASGINPGYLMRRGTLVLAQASALTPTFIDSGHLDSTFLTLFARLMKPESRLSAKLLSSPLRRVMGDMAVLGKGEILLPME